MKRSSRNEKNFIGLKQKNDVDKIINFFTNSFLKQNWDLREAHEKSLKEMEELKKFQSSTFDTLARRRLVEDQVTILELTGKIQELQNEINCMNDSRDFSRCWISTQRTFPTFASQLVSFPPHPVPGGRPSRFDRKCRGRRDGPPSIWDTHGVSGNVFCKSSRVFFSTLSAGIESMEFRYIRTDSLTNGGEEWESNTSSGSEMPLKTVSQKFSPSPVREILQRIMGQTNNDCRSQIFISTKSPHQQTCACWKIRLKDWGMYLFTIVYGSFSIKKVEMVDSVDELKSSLFVRGIQNARFWNTRFEGLLQHWTESSRIPNSKERSVWRNKKAQKEGPFSFAEGRSLYLIYEYFPVTGAHDSVENYADLFTFALRNDDIQEFDSKWDGILLSMTKIQHDDILKGLYKLRIRSLWNSRQYWNCTIWRFIRTSLDLIITDWKTMVKRSIEQDIRNKNFWGQKRKLWEENAVVKNEGDKEFLEIVGNGSPTDSVLEETIAVCRNDINKRAKSTTAESVSEFFHATG